MNPRVRLKEVEYQYLLNHNEAEIFLLTPEMLFGVSLPLGFSCHNTHPKLHMEFGTGRCYTCISHGLPGAGSYRGDQILLFSAVIPPSPSGTGHLCWVLLILGLDLSKAQIQQPQSSLCLRIHPPPQWQREQ